MFYISEIPPVHISKNKYMTNIHNINSLGIYHLFDCRSHCGAFTTKHHSLISIISERVKVKGLWNIEADITISHSTPLALHRDYTCMENRRNQSPQLQTNHFTMLANSHLCKTRI